MLKLGYCKDLLIFNSNAVQWSSSINLLSGSHAEKKKIKCTVPGLVSETVHSPCDSPPYFFSRLSPQALPNF